MWESQWAAHAQSKQQVISAELNCVSLSYPKNRSR